MTIFLSVIVVLLFVFLGCFLHFIDVEEIDIFWIMAFLMVAVILYCIIFIEVITKEEYAKREIVVIKVLEEKWARD